MSNTTDTAAIETAKLMGVEATLIAKYGDKIVPGSVERGTGKWSGKITVEIRTRGIDGEYDGNTRRCATSDVFQVHHTDAVRDAIRKQRAADKRKAKKAAREAAAATTQDKGDSALADLLG